MSVEHRYSARHSIDLQVHIRYRKRRFYCAHARNLSTDGIYLEVQSVTLPTGTHVELEFDSQGEYFLIPAVVAHHNGSGVGVMFRDPQSGLFKYLTRLQAPAMPPRQGGTLHEPLANH
ncbi:MAG: PilZ domain-containing protein [Pseudomonadota bacterium]|nr:PilZ domain-containing protein [Pseudomonadota bacterium]